VDRNSVHDASKILIWSRQSLSPRERRVAPLFSFAPFSVVLCTPSNHASSLSLWRNTARSYGTCGKRAHITWVSVHATRIYVSTCVEDPLTVASRLFFFKAQEARLSHSDTVLRIRIRKDMKTNCNFKKISFYFLSYTLIIISISIYTF